MVNSNLDKDKKSLIKVINSAGDYPALLEGISKLVDEKRELSRYLILPETSSHPDLLISSEELTHYNKDWKNQKKALKQEDSFMPTPDELAEFLKLLKSGQAFDGNGQKVGPKKLEQILHKIITPENYRSENLDHIYSIKDNKLFVTYHKFDSSGKLIKVTEQLDPDTLMEDRNPGISPDNWIKNPTSQGLPRKSVKKGRLNYWYPVEGRVAGFDAYPDSAVLDGFGDASDSSADLGVRPAKIFLKK